MPPGTRTGLDGAYARTGEERRLVGCWAEVGLEAGQIVVEQQGLVPDCGIAAEPVDEPGWIGSSRPSAKLNSLVKC